MNRASSIEADFQRGGLGDARRMARFRSMVSGLARRPGGNVSEVFRCPAEQQAAYDFLEHETVEPSAVQALASHAMARRCGEYESVLLALDGSSLSLTDKTGEKRFGSIGSRSLGVRGLKVLNALAIAPSGQTIGVLAQKFWARGETPKLGYRSLDQRESHHWHTAFDTALAAMEECAPKTRLHVLADREGDASLLIKHLVNSGCDFTIRARGVRKALVGNRRVMVKPLLKKLRPLAQHVIAVPRTDSSPARTASLTVRAAKISLVLRDHHTHCRTLLPLTVVWAREQGGPRGAKAIDWMLYTTVPVPDAAAAVGTLVRYSYRWRIEDFHKMLKSGGGCVEDSQLRSSAAVIKWATLHAIVASRAQRLRDAARTTPEAHASSELSDAEVEALVLLKRQEKRRNEEVGAAGLTLARAVRWLGDLGGFAATGKSTAMPGATVIGRGLERVLEAAQLIETLRESGRMR